MLRLLAVACVLCLIIVHEATTAAVKAGAGVMGIVLLLLVTLKGPGTRRERLWATALLAGATLSWAAADFGHVRGAIWGFIACAAALVVPSFVRTIALAFRAIRNALRIRLLLRAGAEQEAIDDALTRL